MRKLLTRVAALALALTVASPCFANDTVRLGKAIGSGWTFLPADLGLELGIFAKYGIDLEIVNADGDAKLQQALAADSLDMGLGSGPGMAFAVKGSPVIAVAAFTGAPRNLTAVVTAASPVKTVADLRGKLVGVSTVGSLSEWLTQQIAIQEGWGESGIRTVALGSTESSVLALEAHEVDASMLGAEAGFRLEEAHRGRIVTAMDRYAPHFITNVVFVRKELVASNPALVERFLKAFFASIAAFRADRPRAAQIAERVIHMSDAVALRCFDDESRMFSSDGVFDPQAVEVLKRSFVGMGTLKQEPPDSALFTTRFVPVRP